jgi:prevent-host-death family protein
MSTHATSGRSSASSEGDASPLNVWRNKNGWELYAYQLFYLSVRFFNLNLIHICYIVSMQYNHLTQSLSKDKLENMKKEAIVGLKELRENIETYITKVKKGDSFIVVKKSKPVFRISPLEDDADLWESVIDLTKIRKGGVAIKDLLSRL